MADTRPLPASYPASSHRTRPSIPESAIRLSFIRSCKIATETNCAGFPAGAGKQNRPALLEGCKRRTQLLFRISHLRFFRSRACEVNPRRSSRSFHRPLHTVGIFSKPRDGFDRARDGRHAANGRCRKSPAGAVWPGIPAGMSTNTTTGASDASANVRILTTEVTRLPFAAGTRSAGAAMLGWFRQHGAWT